MNACPFCRAGIDPYGQLGISPNTTFYCGLNVMHPNEPVSWDCWRRYRQRLETELTQIRERLVETERLLGEVLDNHICSDPGGEYDWTICGLCNAYTPDHHEGCVMPAIQSFLSPEAEPEELSEEAQNRYNSLVKTGLICPEE